MNTAMIVVHVLACCAVILVVLLSKGKGAELGAAFGGSSQTVFGSQGAGGMLTKLVAICVGVFMMTSLGLAYLSSHRTGATVMQGVESALTEESPVPSSAVDDSGLQEGDGSSMPEGAVGAPAGDAGTSEAGQPDPG